MPLTCNNTGCARGDLNYRRLTVRNAVPRLAAAGFRLRRHAHTSTGCAPREHESDHWPADRNRSEGKISRALHSASRCPTVNVPWPRSTLLIVVCGMPVSRARSG